MSMPSDPPPDPATPARGAPAGRRPRRPWQVGLRTVFLLVAAVAVWTTHALDRRRIAALEDRIARARPLVRELVIDDERQVSVIKLEELWYDENRWDLFLPEGRRYRLCLATRQVDGDGLAPAVASGAIGPGRHLISLEQQKDGDTWRIAAILDGVPRVTADEPDAWHSGSSYGGGEFSQGAQLPADGPVILFRRQFSHPDAQGRSSTPTVSTDGILLWIEPDPDDPAGSTLAPQ